MNLHDPSAAVAFGLGLWTAIQPCPMTGNLAAVAYLGRRAGSPRRTLVAALLFAAGQAIAYVVLAALVLKGIASTWRLSVELQQHVNQVLGPIWILSGMVLLGLIRFRLPRAGAAVMWQSRLNTWGVWSGLPLGIALALAFCPVSATLFFVNVLTISIDGGSCVVYPAVYAAGTALPVILFAFLLAAGAGWLGEALRRTQQVQRWLNRFAGGVLLAVGVYYSLRFNFEV